MKTSVILLLLLTICFGAQAQYTYDDYQYDRVRRTPLKVGARAGVNAYTITDDPNLVDTDLSLGTQIGIYARFGGKFYVEPGLDYVTHSTNAERQLLTGTVEDPLTVRSLRVPVLLGMRVIDRINSPFIFRVMFGPSVAYAVSMKDNDLDYTLGDVQNGQFALNGGIGVDVWVLTFDLMYHHNTSRLLNASNAEGKGRAVSLSVGFRL